MNKSTSMMMMHDGSWHLPDERRGEERRGKEKGYIYIYIYKVTSQRCSKEENMMAWQGGLPFWVNWHHGLEE